MRSPQRTAALAATIALGLARLPMALASGGGPATSEPLAVIEITHDPAADTVVTCVGQDGRYREIRSHNTGTMTSADPRLSGIVTTNEHITIHIESLSGAVVGDMEARDPVTGEVKLDATIYAVFKGVPVKGVIVGTFPGGERLIANFSALHDPTPIGPHRLVAEIGGLAVAGLDLAIVQDIGCTGVPQI